MRKTRIPYLVFVMLMIASMVLAACASSTTAAPTTAVEPTKAVVATAKPTAVVTEAATTAPTAEATAEATPEATAETSNLGTPENPIIMALAPSAQSQELQTGGQAIADKLSEMTGYTIKITVPTNYAALVEAMGSGNAHIGWLPPIAYIVAHEKGYADVGLATVRFGSDHYGVQFVANTAEGFTSYYDAATSASTADAATALAQFDGKKPCWTDPLSASGYVIPFGILQNLGIKTKAGAWVQGHPTVIKSVYLSPKGEICDFGATYIDARSSVATDFPDVNDKVQIVYVSDPLIPNDNVSYATNVPADIRAKLTAALLELSSTDEGKAMLKNGGYDIEGLKEVDDTFYDEFRVYLEAMKFDITSFK